MDKLQINVKDNKKGNNTVIGGKTIKNVIIPEEFIKNNNKPKDNKINNNISKENNIDNKDKENKIIAIKQQNNEENKKNNIALKKQLKEISAQIEDIFYQQEQKKNNKLQNSMDKSNKVDIQEFTNFQSQIDKYKKKIQSKQKEINNNYDFENIIKNENEYKSITSRLIDLKKENDILTKMNKQLKQQLDEISGGAQLSGKTVQMSEKLRYLKDEIKLMNDSSKVLINKIRAQNFEINELEQYIKKVKSNIDYAKAEQEQANKNENNDEMLSDNVIKEMKESIKQLEIEKKEQEDYYNLTIKKQKKSKSQVEQDVKILKIKIQHTKHENKINQLKLKELKKIQDEAHKEQLKREKEERIKEEKRKNEIIKRQKFLEFQQKFMNGIPLGDEDNEAKNYYNNTSVGNYNSNLKNQKFSRYQNKNAPFNIKFKSESRAQTQGGNDTDLNDKTNYKLNNEEHIDNNIEMNNNKGKVIDEIDNLKNDIMTALNEDDKNYNMSKNMNSDNKKNNENNNIQNNINIQTEDENINENIVNNEENENIQIDENYNENEMDNHNENEYYQNNEKEDFNNDISEQIESNDNDVNLLQNNKDIKVSGNRNPFKMTPFKNS